MLTEILSSNHLNGSHIVSCQISNLVAQLTKKNFKQTTQELTQILHQYGNTSTLALLKSLVSKFDLKNGRDHPKMQLLVQQLDILSSKPNFVSLVCQTFSDLGPLQPDFLSMLSKNLKLSATQDLLLALSLLHSDQPDTQSEARSFFISKLKELPTTLKEKLPEPVLIELLSSLVVQNIEIPLRNSTLKTLFLVFKFLNEPIPHTLYYSIDEPTLAELTQLESEMKKSIVEIPKSHSADDPNTLLKQIISSLGPAQVMQELGYISCQDSDALKILLRQFGRNLDESKVAKMIGMMASTHTGLDESMPKAIQDICGSHSSQLSTDASEWKLDVFVQTVSQMNPKLDWDLILECLDYPEFSVQDSQGFDLLVKTYHIATNSRLPAHFLTYKWKNFQAQLEVIKYAVCADPSKINFSSQHQITEFNGLENILESYESINTAPWKTVNLIDCLLSISDESGFSSNVHQLFNAPKTECPHILILSLTQSKSAVPLRDELLVELVSDLLLSPASPHKSLLINRVWNLNQLVIVDTMINLYNTKPSHLELIQEVATSLQSLKAILNLVPYTLFAVDLAALSSKAQLLDLDAWMKEMITEHSDLFVRSILRYIHSTMLSNDSTSSLSQETMALLLNSIKKHQSILSEAAKAELAELLPAELNPADFPSPHFVTALGLDVEKAADSFFQQIYEGHVDIDTWMNWMAFLRFSNDPKQQHIFVCMVKNLLAEYNSNYFEGYPIKELDLTGRIFGVFIRDNLLEDELLATFMRAILNALQCSPESKMFTFGTIALRNISVERLSGWPKYVSSILQISHFASHVDPSFVGALRKISGETAPVPITQLPTGGSKGSSSYSRRSSSSNEQQKGSSGGSSGSSGGSGGSSGGSAAGGAGSTPPPPPGGGGDDGRDTGASLPINTLVGGMKEAEQPDEETRDKIHFILNNVSQHNMIPKAKELKTLLKKPFFDYFAHHIVVHRVSTDSRFQNLYLELIERQGEPELYQKVLKATYRAIHTLLSSSKLASTSERSLLKNLGTWLGSMTLAKNKPVFHVDLALKELILKAYEQGTLYAILPFVARVLQASTESKVFKIPNPWIVAILRLMKEIHSHPRVRQNIKFEIELLFQNIQEDLATLPPSDLLSQHQMYIGPTMNDFTVDATATQQREPAAPASHSSHVPGQTNWMPALHIASELSLFAHQPSLKQLVLAAINRGIDDVLPEAERTVAIVPTTTVRLVLKDFACEPDESKVLSAARAMAQSLASSFTHAIIRNHIRNISASHLRALLEQNKVVYEPFQSQLHRAIDDNLDIACNVLAKHVVDQTLLAVDRDLRPALESRTMHREQLARNVTSRPFVDTAQISPHAQSLPDFLKVRPGTGTTPQQLAIYEGFLRLPQLIDAAAHASEQSERPGYNVNKPGLATLPGQSGVSGIQPKDILDNKKALEKLDAIILELERWAAVVETTLEAAPDAASFMPHLPRLTMTVLHSQERTTVANMTALRVLDLLYTNPRSLRGPEPNPVRDMYARILFALARSTPTVVETITRRFIAINNSEAQPPFEPYNRDLTLSLLGWQLLRCDMLDIALQVEVPRNPRAQEFVLWLVKNAIMASPVLISGSDLSRTLSELEAVLSRTRGPRDPDVLICQSIRQVVIDNNTQSRRTATHTDQLHQQAKRSPSSAAVTQRQQQLLVRQQQLAKTLPPPVVNLFSEWVTLWQSPSITIEKIQAFLPNLQQQGLCGFGDPNLAEAESSFFRGITEAAVLAYLLQSLAQTQTQAQVLAQPATEPTPEQNAIMALQPYAAVDALARLVVILIKSYPEPARLALLQRVLTQTSAALMVDFHSNVAEFNQRPYFRIFSSLLVQLSEPSLEKLEPLVLSSFADLLTELRPQQCPGFAFAWLELVSHRLFMPKLIRHPRACFALHKLLLLNLTFMEPYLAQSKLNEATSTLYQGVLRVFLVLLHDFPEFLCDFHQSFCDVLPPSCIQLRNLILSAFPRNMKLPDPSTPNLKVDLLPASKESPRVFNVEAALIEFGLKDALDSYLHAPQDYSGFLPGLLTSLLNPPVDDKPPTYNMKLINSLVLYVGIYAIADPNRSSPLDLFVYLATNLEPEGRYHFFNAFANQLRYPNSHTHYFSWALLYLFSESPNEAIPEQITRVLLERSISHKPTPWGLLITFLELTKNPRYNFWNREFLKLSADIQRLFVGLVRRGVLRPGPTQ